jgi:hypothetical protein
MQTRSTGLGGASSHFKASSHPKESRHEQHPAQPAGSPGFTGQLDGASIADLVQFECASGRTRVIRIQSRGRTGYLCFDRGTLVHAMAPGAVGDAAALSILSWTDGAFAPAQLPLPTTPTVRSSWQHLLLSAAHAADEASRGKVVEFPPERSKASAQETASEQPVSQVVEAKTFASKAVPQLELPTMTQTHEEPLDLGLDEPAPLRRAIALAVRMDSTSRVLAARGEVEAFSGVVAYGKRLGDLVGESLGIGRLRALKCTAREIQTFVYQEENGHIVGLQTAAHANVTPIDGKLGL